MAQVRGTVRKRPQAESSTKKSSSRYSDHGIVKDENAEDQPKDKRRAQTAHKTKTD
jgi:hypothetical protein